MSAVERNLLTDVDASVPRLSVVPGPLGSQSQKFEATIITSDHPRSDQTLHEKSAKKSEAAKKPWQDPEYRARESARRRDAAIKRWQDPEFRQRVGSSVSRSMKRKWRDDPEYRGAASERLNASRQKGWDKPENHRRRSESQKKLWQDPDYRRKRKENRERREQEPLYRKRERLIKSGIMKKRWEDPSYRQHMVDAISNRWQDPAFRLRRKKEMSSRNNDGKLWEIAKKNGFLLTVFSESEIKILTDYFEIQNGKGFGPEALLNRLSIAIANHADELEE